MEPRREVKQQSRFPAGEAKALRAFAKRRTNGNITGLIRLVAAAIRAEGAREAEP